MRAVRMLRQHLNLMPGDVAGFPPDKAADLIKRGVAEDVGARAERAAAKEAAEAEAKAKAEADAAAKAEADRKAAEEAAKAEAEEAAKPKRGKA